MSNYAAIFDGMFTTVRPTDDSADGDSIFESFGAARDAALEYVRTMRNDLNGCINDLKALRQVHIDEPWKADQEYKAAMRAGGNPWPPRRRKTSS